MCERISVYAVAHQDDWQLFMDPNISKDIVDPGCKTVIIHITAGDAGEEKEYWLAREWGAVNSLLFRVSGEGRPRVIKSGITVGGRTIPHVGADRCSIYFLRLPDGGKHGEGFDRYDRQSLNKMRLCEIGKMTSVDGKNTFSSFGEISTLIDGLIQRELDIHRFTDAGKINLNFPEFEAMLSPNDHSDHLNTALLIKNTKVYAAAKKWAFVHYEIENIGKDLRGAELFWKIGMFSIYHQTVFIRHGHSTISEAPNYCAWCRKNAISREVI
jgi:hypothetical protein